MRPICVPCQRFFRAKKTGFPFIEAMPTARKADEPRARPGTADPDKWEPYKLWMGDRYECEGCGANIVVGVGNAPLAEHYEDRFVERAFSRSARSFKSTIARSAP